MYIFKKLILKFNKLLKLTNQRASIPQRHFIWFSPTPACTASGTCSLLQTHARHLGAALHMTGISAWRTCHFRLHWTLYWKYKCYWAPMLKQEISIKPKLCLISKKDDTESTTLMICCHGNSQAVTDQIQVTSGSMQVTYSDCAFSNAAPRLSNQWPENTKLSDNFVTMYHVL